MRKGGLDNMTVTAKPKKKQPSEDAVNQLINKGGSVAAEKPDAKKSVLLSIPADMLEAIDASVKKRLPVRISRQAWIIETLHERLTREAEEI